MFYNERMLAGPDIIASTTSTIPAAAREAGTEVGSPKPSASGILSVHGASFRLANQGENRTHRVEPHQTRPENRQGRMASVTNAGYVTGTLDSPRTNALWNTIP